MPIDPDLLRNAMRQWATGVTVVTAEHNGVRHGMTVNSFTSVSLTPPLILVSLERTTRTHALVEKSSHFGVTILSDQQQEVSDCFAGRIEREDRFSNLETHTLVSGSPLISGGLAYLDCRVVTEYEAGTHTLFIAEVLVAASSTGEADGGPLLYYNRSYHRL